MISTALTYNNPYLFTVYLKDGETSEFEQPNSVVVEDRRITIYGPGARTVGQFFDVVGWEVELE